MAASPSARPLQVLIQFYSLPSQQEREVLKNNRIVLQDYLPPNAFTAILTPGRLLSNLNDGNLRGIVKMQPAWKASDYLWKKVNEHINSNVQVIASFYPGIAASDIATLFTQYAVQVIPDASIEKFNAYKIQLPAAYVSAIAQWYGVHFINPVSGFTLLDYGARAMEKANIPYLPRALGGNGLMGDSVVIGVGDNTSGIYHIDLKDRVVNYNPAPDAHHGVHINGIAGGAGIIDPRAEGMLPHVTLIDHLYDEVWFRTGAMFRDYNMTITNNSYSVTEGDCNYHGIYDFYANALDQIEQQYPYVQHVFAAGNEGNLNCIPYPTGFGTIAGGYQGAKNILVVTSTDKNYNNAGDGSRGPVRDGRLKPELSANGVDVFSTIGVDVYSTASGTSMASPQVAGALGILTQRYRQLFGNANPRGDVLKAIIINGTTDIGNAGPDYRFGFGFLNVNRSLQILNNNRYTTANITDGGVRSFTVTVPANTSSFKALLYWHDTAASPLSAHQLVNDLDITVTDPTGSIHHPLVLDTAIANINNLATEEEDHVNNCEQVTLNNPAPGTYTITVKGFHVPSPSQNYVVAYDYVPTGIKLTYPVANEAIIAHVGFQVYWDASPDTHTFTIEYSVDNGSHWSMFDNGIPANQLFYNWVPPVISTNQAFLRLTRNSTGEQSVSGPFVINSQPVLALAAIQCPGYINMHWSPDSNSTRYQVLLKKGNFMQPVDTVTDTTYVFSGLQLDSTYYAAIRPLVNGSAGYRSIAIKRKPSDGTCTGTFSSGDLLLHKIIAPVSGRQLTSTSLSSSERLIFEINNLYTAPCNFYNVSYSINNGPWINEIFTNVIPPLGAVIDTITGLNLSLPGSYTIRVAVTNSIHDPVPGNDTLAKTILNLQNQPIDVIAGFTDDFESMPVVTVLHDSIGVSPNAHWDFFTSVDTFGRMRSFVDDSILISGNRSVSLDASQYAKGGNQNYFAGTFNLAAYNAFTDEVRFQFDYLVHGTPADTSGNSVTIHGADTQLWQNIYLLNTSVIGTVLHSGSLSLSDVLYNNHQSFTTSFQLRFGQHDTSLIAARNFGNGITFDNVRLYTVKNDVQMAGVVSPNTIGCGLGASEAVTVRVYNSVRQTQNNVLLFYQSDGGVIVKDTLLSITGKDTVLFTFRKHADISAPGAHLLNVWLQAAGDTYTANDSLFGYSFHNQPLITAYPYLQDFENGDGNWFSGGQNNSWQYGTPASRLIHKAASGTKAWKTNLTGNYNDLEHSYLYSPCFDVSALAHPMLSFSLAMNIENCGSTLCDGAWIEYSTDGIVWAKLGAVGQGTNWYSAPFDLWNTNGFTRWHVASIPLPVSSQPLKLRFVFNSDPGATFEGIAVDDIHIFDLKYPVLTASSVTSATQDLTGNQFVDFVHVTEILASANPQGQVLPNTTFTAYPHTSLANAGSTQYYFPRSFTAKSSTTPSDSVGVRLYILDTDVVAMLTDSLCPSCTRAEDAYTMGITKYDDPNTDHENGDLSDNLTGTYSYYPSGKIKWVPYDQGYYAQLNLPSFSELWFNDGGPTHTFPIGIDYLLFDAQRINLQNVSSQWTSYIDTAVNNYELQRSPNDSNFSTIYSVAAMHKDVAVYNYTDTPVVKTNASVYYRLRYTLLNGNMFYSRVRRIDWTDKDQVISVYPNPVNNGLFYVRWTGLPGTNMKLSLTDIAGRVVYSVSIPSQQWNNTTTLRLTGLQTGMYFLRADIEDNQFTNKLIFR